VKLYITPGSPYARIARIVVLEKGLESLGCALGLEARNPDFRWRPGRPKLCDWFGRIAARPSFTLTAPPSA
jgi:glutathione S-transferase